jgi:hypothetical protein
MGSSLPGQIELAPAMARDRVVGGELYIAEDAFGVSKVARYVNMADIK